MKNHGFDYEVLIERLLFMLTLIDSQLINCLLCNMMFWKAFVKKYWSLFQNVVGPKAVLYTYVTTSNATKSLSLTKA